MLISQCISAYPWTKYSRKLAAKIDNPKNGGCFTPEAAAAAHLRLVVGKEGEAKEGNAVILYWLVDESDGVIVDAKFQLYGQSALIGAAEAACELLIRKNHDQARRISADLLDKHLRDKNEGHAFPKETLAHVNLVLAAIEDAADKCSDIPFADAYVSPPVSQEVSEMQGNYPGWSDLSVKQKIAVIEEVIDQDIRPYIELDAGGVQVLNLIEGREVIIAYQGSCTSCHSATGSTLTAIQQILRAKIDPFLIVTPDMSFLTPTS